MKTNYQSALDRLARADTPGKLAKLDKSFDLLYAAGAFTVLEYSRLTVKILERSCA